MDEAQLRQFEDQVRRHAAADLRRLVDALHATTNLAYLNITGSARKPLPEADQRELRAALVAALDALAQVDYAGTRRTLQAAARQAIEAGARDTGLDVRVPTKLPRDIRTALTGLTAGIRDDLTAARDLAKVSPLAKYGDVMAVVTAARKAANRADRVAAWVVHHGHDTGVQRAVDKSWSKGFQVARVWIAERDACLAICLPLAGSIAEPGEPFMPRFQVGDRPIDGPIFGPGDAHPWCRCRTELWMGAVDDAALTPLDLPYALRREAQRAVATGSAKASEPARVRAAGRLLELGDLLINRTTQKKAQQAVEAGTFQR